MQFLAFKWSNLPVTVISLDNLKKLQSVFHAYPEQISLQIYLAAIMRGPSAALHLHCTPVCAAIVHDSCQMVRGFLSPCAVSVALHPTPQIQLHCTVPCCN